MSQRFLDWHRLCVKAAGLFVLGLSTLHAGAAGLIPEDAAALSRSWTAVAVHDSPLSMLRNPALVLQSSSFEHAFSGSIMPEVELNSVASCIAFKPSPNIGLGVGWTMLADGIWNEQTIATSLAWQILPCLGLGLQSRLILFTIADLPSLAVLSFDLGISFVPLDGIALGLAMTSINSPALGAADLIRPSMQAACTWDLSSSLTLGIGVLADEFGQGLALSCEWRPIEACCIQTSLLPATPAFAAGLGFEWGDMSIQIGSRIQLETLVMLHGVSIGFKPYADEPEGGRHRTVNLNTAGLGQLMSLPGMTRRLAKRVLRQREERPFASVDDLVRVQGMTRKFLQPMRKRVSVMDSGTNVLLLTNAAGKVSWINGMEMRHLMARGIRADIARRILLLRVSLRGFSEVSELELLPQIGTNWIQRVFGASP